LQQCRGDLSQQQEALAASADHDEVVLWFEHDLFCQLHLLYLLDWFSQNGISQTKLSLICIGEFLGKENFRGLGELTPEELASLFPKRQAVKSAQLNLAASAWQAYRSADPTQIERFLQVDSSVLQFVGPALRAHLQRFPSSGNGLGRIENRLLQLIQRGANRFGDLFVQFAATESVYGFGDAQLWFTLRRMTSVKQPLLTITNCENEPMNQQVLTAEVAREGKLALTEAGDAILRASADFVAINGIDQWLGGVHLSGAKASWRWDEQTSSLQFKG